MSMHTPDFSRRLRFHPGIALAILMGVAVGTVALERLSHRPPGAAVRTEAPLQLRVLRFDDLPDGAVAVVDTGSGQPLARFEGEQGFLRGTLRAMARERRAHGVGADRPFELIAHADGRLTLHDPATGMRIALESFGSTNAGVFARLLR
ncbi:MAG: photosynthetic complex assembly protein PuhC [Burkholderiaceae bacterium]|nr:photosynthetic complex assembly protein PuhC [Burkholderiaceae bacterium]